MATPPISLIKFKMSIEEIAKIVEAEASVLPFQGKLAVAQCIVDNRYNAKAFTKPADYYSDESLRAATLAVFEGAKHFANAKLLQFRSFKYNKNGEPDWDKIYSSPSNLPYDLLYLGKDSSVNGEYGHFYFGRYTTMAKPFKMLLIAGHGENMDGSYDPGAIGCGYKEAVLNRELVQLIKQQADLNNLPCEIAKDRNYYDYFKRGNKYDFKPYNYVLEVHFNAFTTHTEVPDGIVKGSMFYIDQSETGHSVEDKVLEKLYSIGSKQAWDGVVNTQRQWPEGLMVQNRVRAQGVSHAVLETCFIDDGDDMAWYQAKKQLVAAKIVEGIIDGFGLNVDDKNPYKYVGTGIATAEAIEDMNVRNGGAINCHLIGMVRKGLRVEVLERKDSGWLKIVWPGAECGFGFTSNVGGKYYRYV